MRIHEFLWRLAKNYKDEKLSSRKEGNNYYKILKTAINIILYYSFGSSLLALYLSYYSLAPGKLFVVACYCL